MGPWSRKTGTPCLSYTGIEKKIDSVYIVGMLERGGSWYRVNEGVKDDANRGRSRGIRWHITAVGTHGLGLANWVHIDGGLRIY